MLRYCGEYYDQETGMIYLRNRYYDPSIGRFISEDTHWNPNNMVYGDKESKDEEIKIPDVNAIMQSSNLYAYCMNNPVKYVDPSGLSSQKEADEIIKENAEYIFSAAQEFGVNPIILAATIYAEQRLNVDWKDNYVDPLVSTLVSSLADVSLGVSQVRISTAILVENEGYIQETIYYECHGNNAVNNRHQGVIEKLLDNQENIRYAAAYLRYLQDRWKSVYPEIDGRTAILATLYSKGESIPHSNPTPNPFGVFAKDYYYYVKKLLGVK